MSDYIQRERVRTDAATKKLKSEHKRVLKRLKDDMKGSNYVLDESVGAF
jgi:hypothetical protein